ncbi:ATP-grasp fold amidoligase family protein [Amphritea sp. HPY]|uniref:ATP-grasp fold amidoligase family protein n=1 Tax=Amphritea sp. HPY TaxID=3421652 RepID=UPI003D7C76D1
MKIFDVFNARRRIKRNFKRELGYPLNLNDPQTYCEKIQWLKLNHNVNDRRVIERADKYLVREYIKEAGFSDCLIKLYGDWDRPEDIDWEMLPDQFVFKINNGSGPRYCWIVDDKNTFNIERFLSEVKERMNDKYGYRNGEFHYSKMPTKIIAEQLLKEDQGPIKDYKFYCFNGLVAFLSVEEGKFEGRHIRDYYNTQWEKHPVDFFNDVPRPENRFKKPDNFNSMVAMSEALSKDYPHIRVDLYNVDGVVYFGELTFTPENGMTQWKPRSLDFEYGKLMDLNCIPQ